MKMKLALLPILTTLTWSLGFTDPVAEATPPERQPTVESDWMPQGMYTMSYDSYGPNLNDVRVAPWHDEISGAVPFFSADYAALIGWIDEYPHTPFWGHDATPDWRSTAWVRDHLLSVGEFMTTRGYDFAFHHLPYDWNGVRGVDCSNFTTLVYTYALGYRFTSAVRAQAGQTWDGVRYDAPNTQSATTRALQERAAGKLVRIDGSTDDSPSAQPFLSVFDDQGSYVGPISDTVLAQALRPGDLVYYSWDAAIDDPKVEHASIWVGKRFGHGFDEIPPHYSSFRGDPSGMWAILHSGSAGYGPCFWPVQSDYQAAIWGARRVVGDTNDPSYFMNSSIQRWSTGGDYSRVSHYRDAQTLAHKIGSTSYVFRAHGSAIFRRPASTPSYEGTFWVDPTLHHKGHSVALTGLAIQWGWLFAADDDTVYKLSYVANSGTWSEGRVLWSLDTQTHTGSAIQSLEAGDSFLVVRLTDGTQISLNLQGTEQ
ncbi:NlpC/P60 family [Sulfidibacter corallicola]|uniref:Uncharacterized protein n=1 Tax=Sulfidibacter corallicola TaxID=2818388 RepID=A0A8A4TLL7_SULCO|nr:hypothetical protein [Sulfidibacter corallicola]QTD50104.1 hypothetical protein J3U87_31355 [Sulfidibacter corallicola]